MSNFDRFDVEFRSIDVIDVIDEISTNDFSLDWDEAVTLIGVWLVFGEGVV